MTGEVRSNTTDDIACWFIDNDYSDEAFFVRHAYFLGADDPYGKLKKTTPCPAREDASKQHRDAIGTHGPSPIHR